MGGVCRLSDDKTRRQLDVLRLEALVFHEPHEESDGYTPHLRERLPNGRERGLRTCSTWRTGSDGF